MLTRSRTDRRRAGFSVVELLVGLVILGLVAGAVAPQVISRLSTAQSATLLSTLTGVRDAVIAHRSDTGRYPRTMRQLVTAPTATSRDVCDRVMPPTIIALWDGPYLSRSVTASGITLASGLVADTLRRNPTGSSEVGTVYIDVTDVDQAVATDIEQAIDADGSFTTGNILWTQVGTTGRGQLRFAFPARAC